MLKCYYFLNIIILLKERKPPPPLEFDDCYMYSHHFGMFSVFSKEK
jgi:hypothetical protein